MPRKHIPFPLSITPDENIFYNFLNNNFCKYKYKRGKYENQTCYIKNYKDTDYCKKHNTMLNKKNNNINIRINIPRCIYITNTGKCNRKVNNYYCKYHNPLNLILYPTIYDISKIKIVDKVERNKENINNNLQVIIYKPNNIIDQIIMLYKKNKKRLKKKKYKKNKKNKNKILNENDKGKMIKDNLFKDDNKYYTINFYDQKVIADNINGVICNYCKTIRYTNSGPCIYSDCYNRSFDDYEFRKYYNIHKKHKISIYNKLIKL